MTWMEAVLVELHAMGGYCRGFEDKSEAVWVHAMKAYRRRRDRVPHIRILGTRWRWLVNFTSGRSSPSTIEEEPGWVPKLVWTYCKAESVVVLTGFEPRAFRPTAQLYRLGHPEDKRERFHRRPLEYEWVVPSAGLVRQSSVCVGNDQLQVLCLLASLAVPALLCASSLCTVAN